MSLLLKKCSKKGAVLSLFALTGLSCAVGAQNLSYTFLELSAGSIETDLGPVAAEADSITAAGSLAISENVFLVAGYTNADYDVDFERTALGVGLGLRHSFSNRSDLYGQILLGNLEEQSLRGDRDDDGYTAEIGIRSALGQQLEIFAGLAQADYFDDVEMSYGFGARAYVTNNASLGVSYAKGEDASSVDFGLRVDL